jgi:hypothetical protein
LCLRIEVASVFLIAAFAFIALAASQSAEAATTLAPAPTVASASARETVLKNYSLEKLHEAYNFLRAGGECSIRECPISDGKNCVIKPPGVFGLMLNLRSIYDQKIHEFIAEANRHSPGRSAFRSTGRDSQVNARSKSAATKSSGASQYPDLGSPEWPKQCASACHCGLYSSILDAVGFEKLSFNDQAIYRSVANLAMNQTNDETKECGLKVDWFCGSELQVFISPEAN